MAVLPVNTQGPSSGIKFDDDGRKVGSQTIKAKQEHYLISNSTSRIDDGEYILTGTYSKDRGYKSNGIYFGKIKDKKVEFMNYYNFLDLENFLNYLPDKRKEKIEKKKERKENRGKELNIALNRFYHECRNIWIL